MTSWTVAGSLVLGVFAVPLGLLPSLFLFRDLANGVDRGEAAERRYRWSVWGGLLGAYTLGVGASAALLYAFA